MKKLFFTIIIILAFTSMKAQLPFSVGATAPDFTATDYHGHTHHLYEYCSQGKYVLVDFFAEWCGPCLATAPKIDQFYHKYGCNMGNIIVLGNECDGTLAQLIAFELSAGLDTSDTYPCWPGDTYGNTIQGFYNPAAFPTICLIGPDSTFIATDIWPISTISDIEAFFPTGVLSPMNCNASVNENENITINNIYPNPSKSSIYIDLKLEKISDVTIEIFDLAGRKIRSHEYQGLMPGGNTIRYNTSGVNPGSYIMHAVVDGQVIIASKISLL